jgi:hypothetical protein
MRKISSTIVPRDIILPACGWIICSWLLTIGIRTPLAPASFSYQAHIQLLMLSIGVGFFIGWPLLRLSQKPPHKVVPEILLDMFVLLVLWQAIFWPLSTVINWPSGSIIILNALICLWTLIIGAFLTLGVTYENRAIRLLTMTVILVIIILPLAFALISIVQGATPAIWTTSSPLELIRQITSRASITSQPLSPIVIQPWIWLSSVFAATILSWTFALARCWTSHPAPLAPPDDVTGNRTSRCE